MAEQRTEVEALYESALSTIRGPEDGGPWMETYREVGGGYEGLQAIAEAALEAVGGLIDAPADGRSAVRSSQSAAEPLSRVNALRFLAGVPPRLDRARGPQLTPEQAKALEARLRLGHAPYGIVSGECYVEALAVLRRIAEGDNR